jgi:hypothetical protein
VLTVLVVNINQEVKVVDNEVHVVRVTFEARFVNLRGNVGGFCTMILRGSCNIILAPS